MVGAPGKGWGVTEVDAVEAGPVPLLFVATTVKVYTVPFARPVMIQGETVFEQVNPVATPPTEAVAV